MMSKANYPPAQSASIQTLRHFGIYHLDISEPRSKKAIVYIIVALKDTADVSGVSKQTKEKTLTLVLGR